MKLGKAVARRPVTSRLEPVLSSKTYASAAERKFEIKIATYIVPEVNVTTRVLQR
jgi:hypothetical protein